MFEHALLSQASDLLDELRRRRLLLATAESCTGGLIAALLTEIAGSSDVVERGFVTYSNEAKITCLGVAPEIIAQHGAVSEDTARAMADGALLHSDADIAVAVTGIAGPGGGSAGKPVGLVHIATARGGLGTTHRRCLFTGNRSAVRLATVAEALAMVRDTAAAVEHEQPE